MTVKDLIFELQKMPMDKEVYHIWDGVPRGIINFVYLSKDGDVMTADYNTFVYSDGARPPHAPDEKTCKYWKLPMDPEDEDCD